MIVVVEGISASGKSSWCMRLGTGCIVPENGRMPGAPDRTRDPAGAAAFWAERNVDRWQAALAMERRGSLALCDTDPLKLHYVWCLRRIGEASEQDWHYELAATRATIERGEIGFADRYLVAEVAPEIARARARADASRSRRNFELHVRLQPALIAWYAALDAVLPGRVQFGLPPALPATCETGERYSLSAFDRMIATLPG